MNYIEKYNRLKKEVWAGQWGVRILSELRYLIELSRVSEDRYRALLEEAVGKLYAYVEENGSITKEIALSLEEDLKDMAAEAKALKVLLIAHAHIDMNWMWGFNETAALTVSTFETILKLMEEYPQFKFSQSQASVYRIIEEYAPYLLPEIRRRIAQGRWEVTASTWVENDKNMSGTEAMVRHILYTKKYLSSLLGVDEEYLNIDFEPDTFGHGENVPEILSQGGIKYYYHCRGYQTEHVYRWRAPSGAELLVYREPVWYNDEISAYDSLGFVPAFCKSYGLHTAMKFYGVGDHGGGPTRKEIKRWLTMQEWPLMPTIAFGTLHEFFESAEAQRESFNVVDHELNYIFTGCYTSQARVKRANRMGEDRLKDMEAVDAMAGFLTPDYKTASCGERAWQKVLFGQFHDILPGSGVLETYQHALGEFQNTMAVSQINTNHALHELCRNLDTKSLGTAQEEDDSLGAGVGFGMDSEAGYMTGYVSGSYEKQRILTVFNTTQYPRREPARAFLWDWEGDVERLCATDDSGNKVGVQVLKADVTYWAHHYHEILVDVDVPPMGYATYILKEETPEGFDFVWEMFSTTGGRDPRLDDYTEKPIVLENERITAVFDPVTMELSSLKDRETGDWMVSEPSCFFQWINENPVNDMTAWRVGPYTQVENLNQREKVRILSRENGALQQSVTYEMRAGSSRIQAQVSLKKESRSLDFDVRVDWHELGDGEKGITQLGFAVPVAYEADTYRCRVPGGISDRAPLAQDVPCTGFMSAVNGEGGKSVSVMCDSKYGFRGYDNGVCVALLRSSYDPDPTPDQGEHFLKIGLGLVTDKNDQTACFETFSHALYTCFNAVHEGVLPLTHSLFKVSDNARVAAFKAAEDGDGWIVRLENVYKEESRVELTLCKKMRDVCYVDILEQKTGELLCSGEKVEITLPAGAVRAVRIRM